MCIEQKMQQQPFTDRLPAKIFTLTNRQGSSISVMDVGATWLSCKIQLANELREVLLGVDSMSKHLEQTVYLGATVGRFANRIKDGRFNIEGQTFQTSTNQSGNLLHGGIEGFDKRRWEVCSLSTNKVTFSLFSEDGDQGFPGNLSVTVSYQLDEDNQVTVEYNAKTDKACPLNLTNHAYFNLLGSESGENCLSHVLQVNADYYLPSDELGIPLSELKPVAQTSFDFLNAKVIKKDFLSELQQQNKSGYDHSFLLVEQSKMNGGFPSNQPIAAILKAPDDSLQLNVLTDMPAIHIYTGNFLQGTPGRDKSIYSNYAGIALETQFLPDSPNHPGWPQPSVLLKPDNIFHSVTRYCFKPNTI
jgi:aldose 1-epimerase